MQLNVKNSPFQTIQLSLSTQFDSKKTVDFKLFSLVKQF